MSGSSHAEHVYSRCIVSLDAGISISWAPDPDGSYESGTEHHQREELVFRERLQRATPGIEVLLDQLEAVGHAFTLPEAADFRQAAQRTSSGQIPICEVWICCAPKLGEAQLQQLVAKVTELVMKEEEEPVPDPHATPTGPRPEPEPEPEPEPVVAELKPWWKVW